MNNLNRRQFLTQSAVVLAGGFLPHISTAQPIALSNQPKKVGHKMKLICVEEHILDPNIAKATLPQVLQQVPYLIDWGKRVKDGNNPDHSRPQIEKNDLINPKGMEFDVKRLADMDAANINMQVLSVGGFPQFASLEMHQQVNNQLSEAIKTHPNQKNKHRYNRRSKQTTSGLVFNIFCKNNRTFQIIHQLKRKTK